MGDKMSLAAKRRKLSLKKSASSNSLNPPEKPKNTIISMFKQQNDKQTKAENEQTEESENEGDVMITNVIGLNTGSASTSGICDRNKQNQERDSAKKFCLFKKKRQKVKDTNDSESAADSDFDLRKPHRKIKARHCKLSKSLSVQDSCIQGRPYTLRKRNTVPIVEVSDSETDNEQKTGKHVQVKTDNVETNGKDTEDVAIKEKRSAKCTTNDMVKSDVDAVKDTEDIDNNDKGSAKGTTNDVIVLPTTGNKGGYFGITEKRKLSDSAEKIKLSLKRSKSGKELRKKSGYSILAKEAVNLFSDNTQIKNDTNEDTLGGVINTAKQNFSRKSYSDKKQTLKKSELFHKETAKEECSINLVEVQDSKKTPATNVGSVLMQKPSGSKEINVIDSESTSNSKDSNCKHMDNNKNGLVRSKANTKNNSKSKSGLKDKKKAQTAEIDIKDKGKTNHDDDDDDNIDASAADSEKTEYRVPYYLENFKTIMESVLDDEENARLFDDIDMKYITTFNELEGNFCIVYYCV
ncbi:fanconi-associated nuclease 1-like [Mercenaria mercenaria]|uniref:fanconi-associated nuclease 1-like n=1 Tax=Mercenaria mercenaria TaxID=6596 RepID=UPI00234EEFB3|nr:fanconi-associated nuclease 1-like [Mercenaria mercenaria]